MAYITGYPICTTPSQELTLGVRRPRTFDRGSKVIVGLDDRVWLLVVDKNFWVELEPREFDGSRYYEFLEYYDFIFEREHFESTMVLSGEVTQPLADGAL